MGSTIVDAGSSWTNISSGITEALHKVLFINAALGFIVGESGTLLKSVDGGDTWSAVASNTVNEFNSICWTSNGTGFIIGENGTLLSSSDSGENWNPIISPAFDDLYSMSFADSQLGYIVGSSGMILKSTDAGNSWFLDSSPTVSRLHDVDFSGSGIGIAVGREGTIIRTQSDITALNEFVDLKAGVYPNPVLDIAHFYIEDDLVEPVSISLYNLLGENILSIDNLEEKHIAIDFSDLESGMYLFTVTTKNGIQKTSKFSKH